MITLYLVYITLDQLLTRMENNMNKEKSKSEKDVPSVPVLEMSKLEEGMDAMKIDQEKHDYLERSVRMAYEGGFCFWGE